MTMWDDERIDAVIDEAARRMTAGEPSGDFRARVMARIDGGPRFAWSWQPVAVAIALAAIVAVVVVRMALPARRAEFTEVRPKPDAQTVTPRDAQVRPKPDATKVRLKPDATYGMEPNATEVRLKPD